MWVKLIHNRIYICYNYIKFDFYQRKELKMKNEKKFPYVKIFLLVVAILLATKMIFDFNGFWKLFKMAGSSI